MVFFSGGKGGGDKIDYGYKGKGMTNHLLIDKEGHPLSILTTSANTDEREQVIPLINTVYNYIKNHLIIKGPIIVEADKGYDSIKLRRSLIKKGLYPYIPYRRFPGKDNTLSPYLEKHRWKVERTISWLQNKYRRLVCRYERKIKDWKGLLIFSLIAYWLGKISNRIKL